LSKNNYVEKITKLVKITGKIKANKLQYAKKLVSLNSKVI